MTNRCGDETTNLFTTYDESIAHVYVIEPYAGKHTLCTIKTIMVVNFPPQLSHALVRNICRNNMQEKVNYTKLLPRNTTYMQTDFKR